MIKLKMFKLITLLFIMSTISWLSMTYTQAQIYTNEHISETHQHLYNKKTIEPNCNNEGRTIYECACGDEYTIDIIPRLEHDYTEWILTANTAQNTNGEETRTCNSCWKTEVREYICTHEKYIEEIQPASCKEEGIKKHICEICRKELLYENIPTAEHSYGTWITTIKASPVQKGEAYRECNCGKIETRLITFNKASDYSIVIPSANINASYFIGEFTQEAVDAHDIVYTTSRLNEANPIIIGHNYRTFKQLHKTEVDSYIYIYIGSELRTYKVIISEKARDTRKNLITPSGYELMTIYDTEHIHLYTCYDGGEWDRWIVVAERIT